VKLTCKRADKFKLDFWLWKNIYLIFEASGQDQGPNQLPIRWVMGALPQEVKHPGHEVLSFTLSSLGINEIIHVPHMSSWRAQQKLKGVRFGKQ
jgi:hypothetical protein